MTANTDAICTARSNLRPLPGDVAAAAAERQRLYEPFPEEEKTQLPASLQPPGCQLLRNLCKECHVFTGKLNGGSNADLRCDLLSCGANLVDVSEIPGLAHIITGKLEGAAYAVAVPVLWNRRLLIYLHGTRPVGAPLVAELNLHNDVFKWLIGDGWIIAATSYRAHGLALTEALADTIALRRHVANLVREEPRMAVLEGHSMGGLAATLLVERHPDLFSAAIGIGSAFVNARLDIPQNRSSHTAEYGNESRAGQALESITHRPLAPLLLLVNVSEMSPAVNYAKEAWTLHDCGDEDVIVPAVWVIKRPGHVAVNAAERLNAILHAVSWVKYGSFGSCRGRPAIGDDVFWHEPPNAQLTYEPSPPPTKCRVSHKVHGEVMSARHTGAFLVSITREALQTIGVKFGGRFVLSIGESSHKPPFHVLTTMLTEYPYRGVEEYAWFGEFEAEHEWLCMHLKTFEYCNGAKALGVKVGMPVVAELEDINLPRNRCVPTDTLASLRVPGGVLAHTRNAKGAGYDNGSGRNKGKGKGKGKNKGKRWIARNSQ